MSIWANAHHSAHLQNTSFLHTRCLLMHDLDETSDEAAKGLSRTNIDSELASLNVRPETPREEPG